METSSKVIAEETEISLRKAFDKKTLLLLSFAAIVLLIYLYLGDVSILTMIEIILGADVILLIKHYKRVYEYLLIKIQLKSMAHQFNLNQEL